MARPKEECIILAGDIGGTKTHLGLFQIRKRRPVPEVVETFASRDAANLEGIVEQFVEKHRILVSAACFGVAGPVQDGRCRTTNLPWDISEKVIGTRFNWDRVRLVNDLAATALAIPLLSTREVTPLNKQRVRKQQSVGLVAPGTGLGMALLVYAHGRYLPVASEGGHVDFGPNNDEEAQLWQYLHGRLGHVSIERIISGPGLVNIYYWLKESKGYEEPAWLARKLAEMDPPKVITEAAVAGKARLCEDSLSVFVSILGAVAGNLALVGMTTGGLYLGGGIPPKILPQLRQEMFMQAFTNKGRFARFLEKIPVRVILNDKAALLGAAFSALEMVQEA